MRWTTLLLAVAFPLAASCGGTDTTARIPPVGPMPPPTFPEPAPSKSEAPMVPTPQVDPVSAGMTVAGVTALCDEHIRRARSILAEVKGLSTQPDDRLTWDSTMGKVDQIWLEFSVGGGFPGLMSMAHPDKDVREAAKLCEPKLDQLRTDMMLDAEFAAVVKRYAARGENLEGTRARLLNDLQRDLRRNGLELPEDKQKELRAINDELSKLQQDFSSNIADAVFTIRVKPERLKGLPDTYVAQHKPGDDGLVELTTNYPDYFPVVTYAEDRTLAAELTAKFDNRAADKNLKILDRVLELRNQKARLLGYPTWADYAIEPRMAKNAKTVREFLDGLAKQVRGPARAEYAEFRAEAARAGIDVTKPLANHNRLYLEQRLRMKKYGFDAKKLSEYFEVQQVTRGLLETVQELYGIELRDLADAPKWHEDVRVLDVIDGGQSIGRIYLDLYPREGKYKHAAMFEIRGGKKLADGRYLPPMAALVCNFPKPGEVPALMTHNDVTTYFHEFGHVLHHVLTRQELAAYAGTNTVRDFVEVPSQVFEEWAYRRETLDRFARHHKTGETIPADLFAAMTKARTLGRALHTERQLSLAALDLAYHTRPVPMNTDQAFAEVMRSTQQFAYLPETHFQATFGHLMGYDAGYYSYQWALAIAQDALTRFKADGWMNKEVAQAWRKAVLEPGAGPDENELVKAFLGRPHNLEAYGRFLKGK